MINKPPPFKGLNIRIPIIIPIKGRGFINHGSGLRDKAPNLGFRGLGLTGSGFRGLGPVTYKL